MPGSTINLPSANGGLEKEKQVNVTIGSGQDGNPSGSAKQEPSRILRYADVFDVRTYTRKLVKTAKNDKKLDRKKPVFVERSIINHKGQHTHTEVDIKSPALCKVLIGLNKDVEGLSLQKEPPFADPALFFHSRLGLRERLSQEKEREPPDTALIADLSTALQYVDEKHGGDIASMENLIPAKAITWGLLWALYTPNTMMYHFNEITEQAQVLRMRSMKVRFRKDATPYWQINCDMIADDGVKFGYTRKLGLAQRPDLFTDLEIDEFDGTRNIQDLVVYPLQYAENEVAIRSAAISRGKKYASMKDHSYWETSGPALRETMNDRWESKRSKFSTHGRAMVDASAFRSFNPNLECVPDVHSTLDREQLTDDQFMICSPVAYGFGFGNKVWGGFAVSRLEDIVWRDEAFRSLVIGQKQKTLIHSLVKQHSSKGTGYDDVVQGKGKGLIGLLSGGPGCGKTLTAEAVAEVTTRPLYMVSAGELGTAPEKVDAQLTLVLELSYRWGAVLLLDEADVFLQERDTKDVARNALVSVFLRQLEYFQGILILTTNRIGECDAAFESRIHFSIHYPDLDRDARKTIWKMFIAKAQSDAGVTSVISDADVDRLAMHEMNGRQIKHAVGSARSIARENNQPFDASHIDTVLEVVEAWNIAKRKQ